MAHRMLQAQHVFRYQSFHINRSQPLGHGSYGAVYKAKCDQLPCAAKVLHPTILDPTDPGASKIMERFQQECAFLKSILHPNIVQYLGMTRDPESRLPVLLMELLDESLTKMLECSQQSLAFYIQVDICYDIALAVSYLHSNDIIHRDLSSNNVLMISGRRAKVTDFGMSKLAGAAPRMTPLTTCPGTLAYMPPEALREPPNYTKKLDCFSEGVIMIQVCTQLWPEPGPRTQIIQDSRYPTGIIEIPIFETERRKNHIGLIDPNLPLLSIAKHCIRFQEKDRPSSEELCQMLANLKESREYRESVQSHLDEMQAKDNQIALQTQQLKEKDRLLQQRTNEIQNRDKALRAKNDRIQQHQKEMRHLQTEIASYKRQLRQLNQQLQEQKQIKAEIQQTNHSQLQRQVSQQSLKPAQPHAPSQAQVRGRQLQVRGSPKQLSVQPTLQVDDKPHPHRVRNRKMTMNWRDGGKAPFVIKRGAAVVNGSVTYFMNWSGEMCAYDSTSKIWSQLPDCPYEGSSLALINGQLTAIGGCKDTFNNCIYSNRLLSLPDCKEVFPPMPTKRQDTTAVTTKEHLIVAGGMIGVNFATGSIKCNTVTVEMMGTKTLVWSTVASLPHPYYHASGTICGDRLYMLGGNDNKGETKSVLTCSLTELLQSSSSSSLSIWHKDADVPAYRSTCAAVNGELLAIGGCDETKIPTAAIHKYCQRTNSWDLICNMPTARWCGIAVVLPTNEMMFVGGGINKHLQDTNKIEVAKFSLS